MREYTMKLYRYMWALLCAQTAQLVLTTAGYSPNAVQQTDKSSHSSSLHGLSRLRGARSEGGSSTGDRANMPDDHTTNCSAVQNKYINTRHSLGPGCDLPGARVIPFLITCIGPCGSHHTAWALNHGGVETGHEYVARDGSASWVLAVDDRCCEGPAKEIAEAKGIFKKPKNYPGTGKISFRRHPTDVFNKVLLQMRCPLKTIEGYSTFLPSSFTHVRDSGLGVNMPSTLAREDCPRDPRNGLEITKGVIHCQYGTTEFSKLPKEDVLFFAESYIKWIDHIEGYADWGYRLENASIFDVCMHTGIDEHRCQAFRNYRRNGGYRRGLSCTGNLKIIDNWFECKLAAAELSLTHENPKTIPGLPSGCFWSPEDPIKLQFGTGRDDDGLLDQSARTALCRGDGEQDISRQIKQEKENADYLITGHRNHGRLTLDFIRNLDESTAQKLKEIMDRWGYREDCSLAV